MQKRLDIADVVVVFFARLHFPISRSDVPVSRHGEKHVFGGLNGIFHQPVNHYGTGASELLMVSQLVESGRATAGDNLQFQLLDVDAGVAIADLVNHQL